MNELKNFAVYFKFKFNHNSLHILHYSHLAYTNYIVLLTFLILPFYSAARYFVFCSVFYSWKIKTPTQISAERLCTFYINLHTIYPSLVSPSIYLPSHTCYGEMRRDRPLPPPGTAINNTHTHMHTLTHIFKNSLP